MRTPQDGLSLLSRDKESFGPPPLTSPAVWLFGCVWLSQAMGGFAKGGGKKSAVIKVANPLQDADGSSDSGGEDDEEEEKEEEETK